MFQNKNNFHMSNHTQFSSKSQNHGYIRVLRYVTGAKYHTSLIILASLHYQTEGYGLNTYMYTYIHVNIYIHIYIYICTYICTHIHIHIYMYTYTYTHTHILLYWNSPLVQLIGTHHIYQTLELTACTNHWISPPIALLLY